MSAEEIQLTEEAGTPLEAPILDPLDNPKINRAAHDFSKLVDAIKNDVGSLSLRAAHRLLVTLAEYPFIKNKAKPSKKEQDIMLYFLMADQQKAIMMDALKLSEEELNKQVLQPLAEERNQKGEDSGKVE